MLYRGEYLQHGTSHVSWKEKQISKKQFGYFCFFFLIARPRRQYRELIYLSNKRLFFHSILHQFTCATNCHMSPCKTSQKKVNMYSDWVENNHNGTNYKCVYSYKLPLKYVRHPFTDYKGFLKCYLHAIQYIYSETHSTGHCQKRH